jgi:hypothetical protein
LGGWKIWKNKVIIGSIIGVFICIIIIGLTFLSITGRFDSQREQEKETKEFRIIVDKDDIRVNEVFNLSVDDIPSGSTLIWNLGDGTTSEGEEISHSYDASNFFNITVDIEWKDGKGFGNKTIGIKNRDSYRYTDGQTLRNYRLRMGRGTGTFIELLPGISNPTGSVDVHISQPLGAIEIEISVFSDEMWEIIYREQYLANLVDINFHKEFQPNDFPNINTTCDFTTMIMVDEGRVGPWEIEMSISY